MHIHFPPNFLNIEKWKAFKGRYPPSSDVDHRIIIVYKDDGVIKYFYVTSQVENARKAAKYDMGSLVDGLDSNDWDVLTKESCIQCNRRYLNKTSESDLRRAYENGDIKVLGDVPEKIRRAIISAVCASNSFSEAEKISYTT
jgi:hypothetical protein